MKKKIDYTIVKSAIVGFWVMFIPVVFNCCDFIYGGAIIGIIASLIVYVNLKEKQKPEILRKENEEFVDVLWRSQTGIDLTFKYINSKDETTTRTAKIQLILKYNKEFKQAILEDRAAIDDMQYKIDSVPKCEAGEKAYYSEMMSDYKKQLRQTQKQKNEYSAEIYLVGYCKLRKENHVFNVANIVEFYNDNGDVIEAEDVAKILGDGKLKRYFE
ncbi:MAG: hypothetical protein IJ184_06670 [Alphaproteobacteria bacterium]|nr:hypothetical protein [Alphaproteobacteria bacterium]